MKNLKQGFALAPILLAVGLLIIGGSFFVYKSKKVEAPIVIDTEVEQTQISSESRIKVPSGEVSGNNEKISSNGKCGLNIFSPSPNEKFTWPLVVKGKVATQRTEPSTDCSWQTFEGVSGRAQLYFNEDNKGWKPVGDNVIFGPDFSITFKFTEIGLPMNTPMKVVFTEENPAVIRPSLVFELPLILNNTKISLDSYKVVKPKLYVYGSGLTSVKILGVPTGTGMTESQLLGNATLQIDANGKQTWVFQPTEEQMLLTSMSIEGYDAKGKIIGTINLPYNGASDVYGAFY